MKIELEEKETEVKPEMIPPEKPPKSPPETEKWGKVGDKVRIVGPSGCRFVGSMGEVEALGFTKAYTDIPPDYGATAEVTFLYSTRIYSNWFRPSSLEIIEEE